MKDHFQIALDGPSGAGKSTLARGLAATLGIVYVDTGAMYRTVGYACLRAGVDVKDSAAVEAMLSRISIDVKFENGTQNIYLNGENPGDAIRTPEISMAASAVSKIPAVRAFLLETQRSIARRVSVVMDGRDIGTVILPDADVKLYVVASPEARARRRTNELRARGLDADYGDVLREMKERDDQDANREIAPARPASDAILFDNSDMTAGETVEAALRIIRAGLEKTK